MSKADIQRKIKSIQENLQQNLNYIDINYKGVEPKRGFILRAGSALINQYKIWLQSSSTDFHRRPGVGGFFDNQLNRYKFDPSSAETIKADLVAES
jgi:hypothetical protein